MKGEKQSKIDSLNTKVNNMEQALGNMMKEVMQNRDLAIGCLNVIKKMPKYDEALAMVKEEVEKMKKEREEKAKENVG